MGWPGWVEPAGIEARQTIDAAATTVTARDMGADSLGVIG
jgi:hypothetical protein